MSPPSFSLEPPCHHYDYAKTNRKHRIEAPIPGGERHVDEVHPIQAGEEGQGDEDGADDGQHLHDLVHLHIEAGEIDLHQAAYRLTQHLALLAEPEGVVAGVTEEVDGGLAQVHMLASDEVAQEVLQG